MSFHRISWASLAILGAVPAAAQTPSEPVAEVANIRFYSNELLNLHHTLYAAAWAGRTEGSVRVLSQKLPHPLTAPFTPAGARCLGPGGSLLRHSNRRQGATERPGDARNQGGAGIRQARRSRNRQRTESDVGGRAGRCFISYFWPEQDRVNRAWIAAMTERVKTIAPEVIPRLEKTYESKWFSTPVRADAVWVGHWGQAYTSLNPPHSVLSSTDPVDQDWSGAELVFHEFSHVLNFKLQGKLERPRWAMLFASTGTFGTRLSFTSLARSSVRCSRREK